VDQRLVGMRRRPPRRQQPADVVAHRHLRAHHSQCGTRAAARGGGDRGQGTQPPWRGRHAAAVFVDVEVFRFGSERERTCVILSLPPTLPRVLLCGVRGLVASGGRAAGQAGGPCFLAAGRVAGRARVWHRPHGFDGARGGSVRVPSSIAARRSGQRRRRPPCHCRGRRASGVRALVTAGAPQHPARLRRRRPQTCLSMVDRTRLDTLLHFTADLQKFYASRVVAILERVHGPMKSLKAIIASQAVSRIFKIFRPHIACICWATVEEPGKSLCHLVSGCRRWGAPNWLATSV